MNKRKNRFRLLAALLALVLLAGCGEAAPQNVPAEPTASAAPAATAEPVVSAQPENTAAPGSGRVVRASTVDEFLAAIAPDTTIVLTAGDYALYTAKNYGGESGSEYYDWVREYDGPGLEIHYADNLIITGEGADKVTLTAEPRYANVLRFVSCRNVAVEGITAGHTQIPGYCSGGVIRFDSCRDCAVLRCGLYGCGTVGVWAEDCTGLTVEDTAIYECSDSAVSLSSCRNVRIKGGEVYRCGRREGLGGAMNLFEVQNCSGVAVSGVTVRDNTADRLLSSIYSRSVLFLSNEVKDNAFSVFFALEPNGAVVDGCRFEGNSSSSWYANDFSGGAADLTGRQLDGKALSAMTLREIDVDAILPPASPAADREVEPGAVLTVRTVDEFLAAVGPERTIVLDGVNFDLSAAENYGAVDGKYYYWNEVYDGYELVIDGLRGLTIKSSSDDPAATTLVTAPRYANVLAFKSCDDLTLAGFTAGHTTEPGACSGGVLFFDNCRRVTVNACRLYGCGIYGLQAWHGRDFRAIHTEIYDCSDGAVNMYDVKGVAFAGCDVHDVPDPAFFFYACTDVSWNDEPLEGELFDMDGVDPVPSAIVPVG